MIRHFCPNCRKRNESSDHLAGLELTCHYCGESLTVPRESAPQPERGTTDKTAAPPALTPAQCAVRGIAACFGLLSLISFIGAISGATQSENAVGFIFAGVLLALAAVAVLVAIRMWQFRPSARDWGIAVAACFMIVQVGMAVLDRDNLNLRVAIFNVCALALLIALLLSPLIRHGLVPPPPREPMAAEHLHELLSKH